MADTVIQRTSFVAKALAWFFAGVGVLTVAAFFAGEQSREQNAAAEAARRAALTPEQRAAEDKARRDAELMSSARYACRAELLRVMYDPDSAKLAPTYEWYIERRRDGTILVQPTGRAKNAFGGYVTGAWNCVVKPETDDVRVVSLRQIRP